MFTSLGGGSIVALLHEATAVTLPIYDERDLATRTAPVISCGRSGKVLEKEVEARRARCGWRLDDNGWREQGVDTGGRAQMCFAKARGGLPC